MPTLYTYKISNYRRIDADTIEHDIDLGFYVIIHKMSGRLYGVNTPELHSTNKLEKAAGEAISKAVDRWLEVAPKPLYTESIQKDKFAGRYDCVISCSNIGMHSLNQWLIHNCMGQVYYGERKVPFTDNQLMDMQAKATLAIACSLIDFSQTMMM